MVAECAAAGVAGRRPRRGASASRGLRRRGAPGRRRAGALPPALLRGGHRVSTRRQRGVLNLGREPGPV